jgi:hypothetical protein
MEKKKRDFYRGGLHIFKRAAIDERAARAIPRRREVATQKHGET